MDLPLVLALCVVGSAQAGAPIPNRGPLSVWSAADVAVYLAGQLPKHAQPGTRMQHGLDELVALECDGLCIWHVGKEDIADLFLHPSSNANADTGNVNSSASSYFDFLYTASTLSAADVAAADLLFTAVVNLRAAAGSKDAIPVLDFWSGISKYEPEPFYPQFRFMRYCNEVVSVPDDPLHGGVPGS